MGVEPLALLVARNRKSFGEGCLDREDREGIQSVWLSSDVEDMSWRMSLLVIYDMFHA
jgi:hypothetical protein